MMVKDLILGKKKHIIKNKKMGYKSDAQRKAVHASKAEKSPAKKELIGDQDKLPEELKAKIKAAPEMKGSPYMMYGKKMSPMTMKGKSPLAKYGCSKKYKK